MPTALIVEDEPEANHLLAMLVQLRGYRTDSAYTGGEALEKVRQQPPDIVFLDLMLPDINGYEVCKSIKASRPSWPGNEASAETGAETASAATASRVRPVERASRRDVSRP